MSRERVVKKIQELLKANEMTMRYASLRIGMSQSYLHQFITRGNPQELPESVREDLAVLFRIDPDELRSDVKRKNKQLIEHPGHSVREPILLQVVKPIIDMLEKDAGITIRADLRAALEQGLYQVCLKHVREGLRPANAALMAEMVQEFNRINYEWIAKNQR
jgi:hypothetical protein